MYANRAVTLSGPVLMAKLDSGKLTAEETGNLYHDIVSAIASLDRSVDINDSMDVFEKAKGAF